MQAGGTAYERPVHAGAAVHLAAAAITVRHVEMVQTVQTLRNEVPLTAGKPTLVRVYLSPEDLVAPAVLTGEIAWTRGGGAEHYLPAMNAVALDPGAALSLAEQRRDIERSLNFRLPPGATMEGALRLRVNRVFAPASGDVPLHPRHTSEFQFVTCAPLRVRVIGLRYLDTGSSRRFSPDAVHFAYLRSYLRRAYPAPSLEWSQMVVDADFTAPFATDAVIRANAQLAALRSREVSSGVDPRTHYYGLVADANGAHFLRGRAFTIPGEPRPDTVATGPAGAPGGFAGDQDLSYADWYGAHELGHTFGRYHPGFPPGGQDASDPAFPYPDGRITVDPDDAVGFDPGDPTLGLPMRALPGTTHHDVMTYADNQWLSAYTFEALRVRLNEEDSLV